MLTTRELQIHDDGESHAVMVDSVCCRVTVLQTYLHDAERSKYVESVVRIEFKNSGLKKHEVSEKNGLACFVFKKDANDPRQLSLSLEGAINVQTQSKARPAALRETRQGSRVSRVHRGSGSAKGKKHNHERAASRVGKKGRSPKKGARK